MKKKVLQITLCTALSKEMNHICRPGPLLSFWCVDMSRSGILCSVLIIQPALSCCDSWCLSVYFKTNFFNHPVVNQYFQYNASPDSVKNVISRLQTDNGCSIACHRLFAKVSYKKTGKWGFCGISNKLLPWSLCIEYAMCFTNRRNLSAQMRKQIACINMHKAQRTGEWRC